jgi:hypothetical protein
VQDKCYRRGQVLEIISLVHEYRDKVDVLSMLVKGRVAQGLNAVVPDSRLYKVIIDRLRRRCILLKGMHEYQQDPDLSGVSHKMRALWSAFLTKRYTCRP